MLRSLPRRAAAVLALVALSAFLAAAGRSGLAGSSALSVLNAERARLGIPGSIVENAEWSRRCALHNHYLALNDDFGHDESPANPGYTPEEGRRDRRDTHRRPLDRRDRRLPPTRLRPGHPDPPARTPEGGTRCGSPFVTAHAFSSTAGRSRRAAADTQGVLGQDNAPRHRTAGSWRPVPRLRRL